MTPRQWLELARSKDPNRPMLGWIQRDRGRWFTSDGHRVHVIESEYDGDASVPPSVAALQVQKMPEVYACGESCRYVTHEGLMVTWPASLCLRSCMPMARTFDEVAADAMRERWEAITIGAKQLREHLKAVPHFNPNDIAPRPDFPGTVDRAPFPDGFGFVTSYVRDAVALAKPRDLVRIEYSAKPAVPCLIRVGGVSAALVMPFRVKRATP